MVKSASPVVKSSHCWLDKKLIGFGGVFLGPAVSPSSPQIWYWWKWQSVEISSFFQTVSVFPVDTLFKRFSCKPTV